MTADVVVVVGACGGVGASTTAALLARERARDGARVALVDLHVQRGGIDVLLGLESAPGPRWAELGDVRGSVAPQDLVGVLPRWEGVEVLSGGRDGTVPTARATAAVGRALVDGCAVVVVDLPVSRLGSEEHRACWSGSGVLLVTGQDVLGVAAALPVRALLEHDPAHLVLRRRRRARVAAVEAAHVLDLPLGGSLPTDRRTADAVDRGLGPQLAAGSALGRAVRRLATRTSRG